MSKKVIVSLFIFLLIISCSNNDANGPDTNSIIGTWNLTTMKVDGSTINPDEEDSIPYKIRFHSDNSTGVVWMKDYGLLDPDSPMSFTWFTNGNILTIMVEEEVVEKVSYSVSGNTFSMTETDGSEIVE